MLQMFALTNARLVHRNSCGPRSEIKVVNMQINLSAPMSKNQREAAAHIFMSAACHTDHRSRPGKHRKESQNDVGARVYTAKATSICSSLCSALHHRSVATKSE